jgi:hypothetical protein
MWYYVRAKNMGQYVRMLEAVGFHSYELDNDLVEDYTDDETIDDFNYIATLVRSDVVPRGMSVANDTSDGTIVSFDEFIELYDDRSKVINGVKVTFHKNGSVTVGSKTFCRDGIKEFIAEYTREI